MDYIFNTRFSAYLLSTYLGVVSTFRIFQFQGGGKWHEIMFGRNEMPFLDWWWLLIPSFIFALFLVTYTSRQTQKIVIGVVTAITLFFIIATYL